MFQVATCKGLMCQVHARPCKQYNKLRFMKLYINISLSSAHPPLRFGIGGTRIHWESQWMQTDDFLVCVSFTWHIRMKTEFPKTKSKTVKQSLLKSFLAGCSARTFIGCFAVFKYCNVDILTYLLSYMFTCVFAHPYITGAGQVAL